MPVTLQKLPIEIFHEIASYLSPLDQQSLRHVSRGFRPLIKPLRRKTSQYPFIPNRRHLIFVRRLFKDNLFACRGDVGICPACANVCLKSEFFKSGIYVDSHKICVNCEKVYIEQFGLKEPVHGVRTFRCWLCSTYGLESNMHWHDAPKNHKCEDEEEEAGAVMGLGLGRTKPWCCAVCHMGMCDRPACEGWPPGFVNARENRNHFRRR